MDDDPTDAEALDRAAADADADALDRAADAELDALAEEEGARPRPPRRPWVAPLPVLPPVREYDRRLAVLTPGDVGEFLRACRANAGLSQRQVAEAAGVPQSTVARLEAGHTRDVLLSTIVRLAEECDVILVGATGSHAPLLESDHAQRHRDRAGRLLPAHLFNAPYEPGVLKDARRGRRGIPTRTFFAATPLRDVPDD